jgi:hypothetical protein
MGRLYRTGMRSRAAEQDLAGRRVLERARRCCDGLSSAQHERTLTSQPWLTYVELQSGDVDKRQRTQDAIEGHLISIPGSAHRPPA